MMVHQNDRIVVENIPVSPRPKLVYHMRTFKKHPVKDIVPMMANRLINSSTI